MSKQTGKVVSARIYTCKDSGIPSRDNTCLKSPRATYNADQIMGAIHDFAYLPERCKLVLELDNGQEISIMPILKKGVAAFYDEGFDPSKTPKSPWDIEVEVWPR